MATAEDAFNKPIVVILPDNRILITSISDTTTALQLKRNVEAQVDSLESLDNFMLLSGGTEFLDNTILSQLTSVDAQGRIEVSFQAREMEQPSISPVLLQPKISVKCQQCKKAVCGLCISCNKAFCVACSQRESQSRQSVTEVEEEEKADAQVAATHVVMVQCPDCAKGRKLNRRLGGGAGWNKGIQVTGTLVGLLAVIVIAILLMTVKGGTSIAGNGGRT
ncbi:hypothetical protein BC830DRAFT_1084754 [Chytriomyces sp. MP71]|nr:hypothetical protein BC830DRAFT_1084754 [Chytriomyces sp. MP71]